MPFASLLAWGLDTWHMNFSGNKNFGLCAEAYLGQSSVVALDGQK